MRKRQALAAGHPVLSISRQCQLLGLPRTSVSYQACLETAENMELMRQIDRQYLASPFYGARRMTAWLARAGHAVNGKRVRRLMRLMGLEVIYPKPRQRGLRQADRAARKYPYLLRGLVIDRSDQVWAADSTYVPLRGSWAYLAAIMDWFRRRVLAWELSAVLETGFCLTALRRALARGHKPAICNTDQGSQFTSG